MPQHYARELRERIELLTQTRMWDGSGGKNVVYVSTSPPTTMAASVKPRSASEVGYADQLTSQERLDVVIRYRAGLNQTMRIRYGLRTFEIVGILDPDERHRWLELDCEERIGE